MKRILKWVVGIFVLLLLIIIFIPLFFKDKISAIVKEELKKSINAEINYKSLVVSLIENFPNLSISANKALIIGIDDFSTDTLANIDKLSLNLNLLRLLSNEVQLKSILVKKGVIYTRILESGKANWDILKKENDNQDSNNQSNKNPKGGMGLFFEEVVLKDIDITYNDNKSQRRLVLEDINMSLKGKFIDNDLKLKLKSEIPKVRYKQKGKTYVDDLHLRLNTALDADLDDMHFSIKDDGLIVVNNLELSLKGDFGMKNDKYPIDIKLSAPNIDFKSFLSLLPSGSIEDIEKLETKGNISIESAVKGEYYDDHYPAFKIKVLSENTSAKYAGLSEAIQDIGIKLFIDNPGGKLDNTTLNVEQLRFTISDNSFTTNFRVLNPISNPKMKGNCKGVIDFSKLQNAIPVKDMNFSGIVNVDLTFDGTWSDIEKEKYEKLNVSGNSTINNFMIRSKEAQHDFNIHTAMLQFNPRTINLTRFDANYGKSDLKLTGKIENYLQYILKNKDLKGSFRMTSNQLNLNDFMVEEPEIQHKAPPTSSNGEIELGIIKVPDYLDLTLHSDIKNATYKNLDLTNISGVIYVKDSKASLDNLQIHTLDGDIVMAGHYSTLDPQKPQVNLDVTMKDVNIDKAYNSIKMLREMMPISASAEGVISSDLKYTSLIDGDLNPVTESMNGQGSIRARNIVIKDSEILTLVSKLLNNESYSRLSISQLNIDYTIENGNILLKPFETKLAGKKATISGIYGSDKSLDFDIKIVVPKNELGSKTNNLITNIPGIKNMDEIDVIVKIEGTSSSPKLSIDLANIAEQAGKSAIKKATEKIFENNNALGKITKDSVVQKVIEEGLFNIFTKPKKRNPKDSI